MTRQRLLGIVGASVLAIACDMPRQEYSAPLTEPATVENLVYTPRSHGSGSALGMTLDGDLAVSSVSVTVPEVHGVLFRCQHGNFFVRSKEVWQRMRQGQPVTVTYREVYRVTSTTRELIDYDFVDAR